MEKEKLSSQMEKKPQKGIPETWTGVIPRHIEELITQLAQSGGMKPLNLSRSPKDAGYAFTAGQSTAETSVPNAEKNVPMT